MDITTHPTQFIVALACARLLMTSDLRKWFWATTESTDTKFENTYHSDHH
jgi:hypothetical protein